MNSLYEKYFKSNILSNIIFLYTVSVLITAGIFYKLIPLLLNYAPEYSYIDKLHGISYFWQYFIVVLFCLIIGNISLYFCLRKVNKVECILKNNHNQKRKELFRMKRKLFYLPYQIYFIQNVVPIIILTLVILPIFVIQKASLIIFLRLIILIIVFFLLLSIINLVVSQQSFKKILLKINSGMKIDGIRISIVTKLFLQMIPIILSAILFTSLIGYSSNIRDKGNLMSEIYLEKLNETFSHHNNKLSLKQIKEVLLNMKEVKDFNDYRFIITPEEEVITFDNIELESYFLEYLHELSISNGGYVYDITGETRGVIVNILGEDGNYIVGVKFNVISTDLVVSYMLNLLGIMFFSSIALYVSLKTISNDIKTVVNNLNETSAGKNDIYRQLPVTSNDEISDLVLAFNKIQRIVHSDIEMKNVELQQSKTEIDTWYRGTVNTIRLAIDAKDHYTHGHSNRVSKYSVQIGEALNLSKNDIELLRESGIFHDVGKIGIDDKILKKAGKLTTEEYNEMKKHPEIGVLILSAVSMFEDILPIVLYHHEKFNGTGYPKGLSGEDIPFLARILAIADAFDAMTTDRIYQKKLSLKEAKEEVRNGSGTQFDPYLADVLIELINHKIVYVLPHND